jgi:hypothetical protein
MTAKMGNFYDMTKHFNEFFYNSCIREWRIGYQVIYFLCCHFFFVYLYDYTKTPIVYYFNKWESEKPLLVQIEFFMWMVIIIKYSTTHYFEMELLIKYMAVDNFPFLTNNQLNSLRWSEFDCWLCCFIQLYVS